MLRTNLATRPFYNERAVHLLLGLAALVVLGLTIFNIVRIASLSKQNTELASRVNQERSEAARLRQEAAGIRRGINQADLKRVVSEAEEANSLIDQRTFSWTQFFNHIEATLPPDVMLTAVHPTFEEGRTVIAMTALGRRAEDLDEFMEKLEATGAFEDVLPAQEDRTEEGLHRATLRAVYTGASEPAEGESQGRETATQPQKGAR